MKNEKIIVIILAVLVVAAFFIFKDQNTLLFSLIDPIDPIDWSNQVPIDVVKSAIPIQIIEKQGQECIVKANKLEIILDHEDFVKGTELEKKLKFNRETSSIKIPCDLMKQDDAKLHIWFIIETATKHGTGYEYYITDSNVAIDEFDPVEYKQ